MREQELVKVLAAVAEGPDAVVERVAAVVKTVAVKPLTNEERTRLDQTALNWSPMPWLADIRAAFP